MNNIRNIPRLPNSSV